MKIIIFIALCVGGSLCGMQRYCNRIKVATQLLLSSRARAARPAYASHTHEAAVSIPKAPVSLSLAVCGMSSQRCREIEKEVCKAQAKRFLREIFTMEEPICNLNVDALKQYLEARLTYAEMLLMSDKSCDGVVTKKYKQQEIKALDAVWNFTLRRNSIETNPNMRVLYQYPKMVEENCRYVLRKRLGCYSREPSDALEKEYVSSLKKVTPYEFSLKLRRLHTDEIDTVLLESSRDLSDAILEELSKDSELLKK